jgi:Arm domain-containing DNA-binding protein
MLTEAEVEAIKSVRYERKVWDGRGLYLLVTPKGGRRWRYAYRLRRSTRSCLWESTPWLLSSWLGHVTSSLATCSRKEWIPRP